MKKEIVMGALVAAAVLTGQPVPVDASGRAAAAAQQAQEQARRMESMIRSVMRKNRIVGMSAVVVAGDDRLLCGGWGWEDAGRRKPVTADSLFPLGSITKLFTATAVMQLVERGEVDLDAPLSRYLPELAAAGRYRDGPTARQVLTHHGGLMGNYMDGFEQNSPDPGAFRKLPGLVAAQSPASAPDTIFAYSNTGYALLGCLVERVTGLPYTEVVTRKILRPLGMETGRFFQADADAGQCVMGFEGRRTRGIYPIRDIPAGSLMASASDMQRFMQLIFDGGGHGVLGSAAFAEMTRRQNAKVELDGEFSIGLGYWLISPLGKDERFVSHGGDLPPFHALLVTVPDRRTGVFLAANSSGAASALIPLAVDMIRSLLADGAGAAPAQPVPAQVRPDPRALAALPGSYASPMGLIRVRCRGERIFARVQGAPVELIARADGTFTLQLSVLGLVSIPLRALAPLRMAFESHGGRSCLRISALGIMAGVAERYEPQLVPGAWQARAGAWRRLPGDPNGNDRWPAGVSIRADRRSGLLLRYSFPGLTGSFPLEVADDERAVIRGKGTGLGETIAFYEEAGRSILEWSGMRFEKR